MALSLLLCYKPYKNQTWQDYGLVCTSTGHNLLIFQKPNLSSSLSRDLHSNTSYNNQTYQDDKSENVNLVFQVMNT